MIIKASVTALPHEVFGAIIHHPRHSVGVLYHSPSAAVIAQDEAERVLYASIIITDLDMSTKLLHALIVDGRGHVRRLTVKHLIIKKLSSDAVVVQAILQLLDKLVDLGLFV